MSAPAEAPLPPSFLFRLVFQTLPHLGVCLAALLATRSAEAQEPPTSIQAWLKTEATPTAFVSRGEDNVRYLELTVNQQPVLALVDTGADACWVLKSRQESVKAPKAMSLVKQYRWKTAFSLGNPPATSELNLMVGDFSSLERENSLGRRPIDLVCGEPFFKAFPGLLDFSSDCYWVYRNPLSSNQIKEKLSAAGWNVMNFETVRHYHFFPATVAGEKVRFLADTGTGHTLIQDSLATRLGFTIERIGGKMIGLAREHGVLSSCIARELDFGAAHFSRLPVIVSDDVRLLGQTFPGGPPVRGILGAELMRAAGVLYDASNGWMAWPTTPFDPLAYAEVNPIGGTSREKLPAQVREATDIAMVRVNSVKYNSVGVGAKTRRMATVEMRALHVIKGKCQEGDVFSLRTEVTAEEEEQKTLAADYQGRKGRRLVLFKRDANDRFSLVSWFDYWSDRYMLLQQLASDPQAK